jgi:GNAT superfamily N-acetyltransferase
LYSRIPIGENADWEPCLPDFSMMTPATLVQARSEAEYASARALFVEYAEQLGVDLCFQGFASELESLDTMYGPPSGCLILARRGDDHVGCVGVRRFSPDDCEMKRLYLRNDARGSGLGLRLARAAIDAARTIGYKRMLLDTLDGMAAARAVYRGLGFKQIAAYYGNPLQNVVYMALEIRKAG